MNITDYLDKESSMNKWNKEDLEILASVIFCISLLINCYFLGGRAC